MSNPFNWTSGIIGGAGLWDQLDRYDDIGGYIDDELSALEGEAIIGSEFQPFGVGGQFGRAITTEDGGISYQSSFDQKQKSAARSEQSNNFFNDAAQGSDAYQQSVFDSIRAMQMPEEQRQRTEMEQRLQAQGRGGMMTNQYGGSPEQLAMAKAIGENMNNASFRAFEAGQQKQMQDAELGGMFQQSQYMPEAVLANQMNQGLQLGQLTQAGQLGGLNLASQLGLGRINANVNNEKIRAELMGSLFNQIGGAFNNSDSDPLGDIFSNIFKGLF